MYKKILTKKFFDDNPVKELTTQRILYSVMLYDGIEEFTSEFVRNTMDRGEREEEQIRNENSSEVLLKMMRGKCDTLNHSLLHSKILEHEDELLPKIITMLKTSLNDVFIEHSVKVIGKAQKNCFNDLMQIIDEIRSPYALSLVLVVIGYLGDESAIPKLLEKHSELKKLYSNETYEQGALLGLIELRERFKVTYLD